MSLKERIISETTDLFVTYGLKSIRMDDIAENLGVSKRTIYEIFGDKENLILECMRFHSQEYGCKKMDAFGKGKNIIEEMLTILEDWDKSVDVNYKLISNLKKFYPKVFQIISEENQNEGFSKLRQKLIQGVEDGLLVDDINYDLAIYVFSNSIYGITNRQNIILPKNVSEKDAYKYVITYFFRGIATEKGIKMIDEYIEKEKSKMKRRRK